MFASLCASDLSGTDLTLCTLHTLLLPTGHFLKTIHGNNIPMPIIADYDDTLGDVVKKILAADEHRAWVCN